MAKRGRPRHPDILTPREWDVLALLREGATNEQIAERLGITERTAKFHVSEILSKLGVNSREEAAAWRPEERRPWWLAAGVPLSFVWRRTAGAAGHGVNAVGVAIGGAMFAAVIAGIVLLALFLSRGGGSGSTPATEARIAFSAGGSIYTVRPDGSEVRKVIAGDRQAVWNAAPALSPDGSRIAYTRDENIWIANSDGNGAHELPAVRDLQTPPDGGADTFSTGAQSIAWAPDGKHIAYVLGRIGGSGVQDVWVMGSDGSGRTRIYQGGAGWIQPVWLDNGRVAICESPGQIRVFRAGGEEEPAITFGGTEAPSLAALPVTEAEWLVGPITTEGPITLGSPDTGRKTVATGVAAALAPGGAAFAYFKGDALYVSEIGGSADEQILDLAPLGGRDRFFGEQPACFPNSSPACSYRLAEISWTGSPEANAPYIPARTVQFPALGIELKYPGGWIEGAALRSWDLGDLHAWPCSNCVAFGPRQAALPHGVYIYTNNNVEPDCIVDKAWRCPVAARAHGGIDAVRQGQDRHISVAGEDAGQADVLRTVPLGVRSITGESTPDDEIWTIVPLGHRALYVVAFWREGDALGEQETRAGYDVMLKSLVIDQR